MRYIVRSVDGAEYGPFTREELQLLVRERRLGPGDFVRREAGRTWSPFERIAGLSDVPTDAAATPPTAAIDDRARPAREDRPTTADDASESPVSSRPRLEAAPERLDEPSADLLSGLDVDLSIELDPVEVAIPAVATPSPPTTPAAATAPRSRPTVQVDPAVSENPFVAAGLPIDVVSGEELQFVLVQSFLDALRGSMIGAVLGHRGRLICTDRRAVVVRPGFGRSSMTVAWLDRIDHAGVEARLGIARLVLGVICLMYAAYALAASLAGSLALAALGGAGAAEVGGVLAVLGSVIAVGAGLLGVLLVATARGRVVAVGEGLQFPCAAAGPWHLARIDEGRMRAVDGRIVD